METQQADKKPERLYITCPAHMDKSAEGKEFIQLFPKFYFVLGRGEQLTKNEFTVRLKRMFETDSDPGSKIFIELAGKAKYLSVYRASNDNISINY